MGVQWRISLVRNPQVRRRSGRKQQPSHPAASKHELHGYSANRVADPCRREALLQVTAVSASTLLGQASWNLNKQGNSAHAAAVKGTDVSTYLPEEANYPGWVRFSPDPNKTPALRSGAVRPYSLLLPKDGGWKEQGVPNAISGNYCQPKCDEPTTEVKFASADQGTLTIQIAPLFKVTSQPNPDIKSLGSPRDLVQSFGPYMTGSTIEDEDVIDARQFDKQDGQTFYLYEISSPFAISGSHNYGMLTFKGSVGILCSVACSEGQWNSHGQTVREMVESFEV